MSLASKPRNVKAKGAVRELKIVHSISRRGADTLKAEEVKTPRRDSKKGSSSSRLNQLSSPTKRPKRDGLDAESIPFALEGPDEYKRRQTLVFPLP
jgi:hypothetical protein